MKLIFKITVKGLIALLFTSSWIYTAEPKLSGVLMVESIHQALWHADKGKKIVINYYDPSVLNSNIKKNVDDHILSDYRNVILAQRKEIVSDVVYYIDRQEHCYKESVNKNWEVRNSWQPVGRLMVNSFFADAAWWRTPPGRDEFVMFLDLNVEDYKNKIILNVPADCDEIFDYELDKVLKNKYGQGFVGIIGQKKLKKDSFLFWQSIFVVPMVMILVYFVYKKYSINP